MSLAGGPCTKMLGGGGSRARGSVWGPVDDVPELIGVFLKIHIETDILH